MGLEAIVEVYTEGQKQRMASVETKVFFQKLEADLNRYKIEIMLHRDREAKYLKIVEDNHIDEEMAQLVRVTK